MSEEIAEIEYTEPSFLHHDFKLKVFNVDVKFEVLKLKDSTFIWIGDLLSPRLTDLSFALASTVDPIPITTKIIGTASTDSTSLVLAERLNKKLKKAIYVSFNISVTNDRILEEIEKRLIEEIDLNASMF